MALSLTTLPLAQQQDTELIMGDCTVGSKSKGALITLAGQGAQLQIVKDVGEQHLGLEVVRRDAQGMLHMPAGRHEFAAAREDAAQGYQRCNVVRVGLA